MTEPNRQKPLSEKFIWVVALLLVLGTVAIALPSFLRSRGCSCANACVNNLRQLDAAANEFALENGCTNGYVIHFPNDLTPYIKLNTNGNIPHCPAGGKYTLAKVGDTPTCSLGTTVTPTHVLP